jgi:hypothetical protein
MICIYLRHTKKNYSNPIWIVGSTCICCHHAAMYWPLDWFFLIFSYVQYFASPFFQYTISIFF